VRCRASLRWLSACSALARLQIAAATLLERAIGWDFVHKCLLRARRDGEGVENKPTASIGSDSIHWRPHAARSTVQLKPFLPGPYHIGIVEARVIDNVVGHDQGSPIRSVAN
jgi:hypothetical protein